MHKKLSSLGLILANTHARGLRIGQDFNHLQGLPTSEDGKAVDPDYIWSEYDKPSFAINGSWDTDARLCLESRAPRPCTLLAAVPEAQMT